MKTMHPNGTRLVCTPTIKDESTVVHNPRHICMFYARMHGLSVCMVFKRAVLRSCASSWNHWKIKQPGTRPMHALCDMTRGGDIINACDFITIS